MRRRSLTNVNTPGVTTGEIDLIREHQEAFLPDTVIIRRRKYAGDGEFAPKIVGEDIAARITPGFGSWRDVADRFQGITAFTISVAHDQEIEAGYEVIDQNSR